MHACSLSPTVLPTPCVCVRAVAEIKTKCRAFDENVTRFAAAAVAAAAATAADAGVAACGAHKC